MKLDLALLLLRFSGLGLAVFHGWGKLTALLAGSSRFPEALSAMGLPFPGALAWAAALAETVGGALVFIGLGTRVAAAFCAVTMMVAAFVRHHAHHYLLGKLGLLSVSADQAQAWGDPEKALLFLLCFLALALAGGGAYAIDALRAARGKARPRR